MIPEQTLTICSDGFYFGDPFTLLDLKRAALIYGAAMKAADESNQLDPTHVAPLAYARDVKAALIAEAATKQVAPRWMPDEYAVFCLLLCVQGMVVEAEQDRYMAVLLPMIMDMPDLVLANVRTCPRDCTFQWSGDAPEHDGDITRLNLDAPQGLFDDKGNWTGGDPPRVESTVTDYTPPHK